MGARVWRDAMQGERMSHSASYGDDEQRRSVPARCDPGVTVIYERLLSWGGLSLATHMQIVAARSSL
ncbi:hypothetical protein [Nitrosomonas sp.]|uniref:hypothetical protein n=1 Tax=Nitrosomonas sp. TaxID=42353 RepID=UPI0025CBE851|nr:hypothetical protein [Nitrosomonas sp.]